MLGVKQRKLERHTGLDPASIGLELRCTIHCANGALKLEPMQGIEPRLLAYKASALPLS